MPEIPPAAIEAAAQAMSDDWNPDRYPVLTAMNRDYATAALTAALPHIEAALRADERERILRAASEVLMPRPKADGTWDDTDAPQYVKALFRHIEAQLEQILAEDAAS